MNADNGSNTNLTADYERDGFVVIPNMFSTDECRELKQTGLNVLREYGRPNASVYVGLAAASPVFYNLASDDRLIGILRQLMPNGVMFMSDKFVFKSGEQRSPTPWHCDHAYWPNTRPKLSVWIPFDDVTAENGALKVLPGTHKQNWAHRIGETEEREFISSIKDLPRDAPGEMICEMSAGSALFFADSLPHASTPNNSGTDRYALISTYHTPAPDDYFDVEFPARHVIVEP